MTRMYVSKTLRIFHCIYRICLGFRLVYPQEAPARYLPPHTVPRSTRLQLISYWPATFVWSLYQTIFHGTLVDGLRSCYHCSCHIVISRLFLRVHTFYTAFLLAL
jgi:hypothetical protein